MPNYTQCGSPIPKGQQTCSMCYEYMEEWERQSHQKQQEQQEEEESDG